MTTTACHTPAPTQAISLFSVCNRSVRTAAARAESSQLPNRDTSLVSNATVSSQISEPITRYDITRETPKKQTLNTQNKHTREKAWVVTPTQTVSSVFESLPNTTRQQRQGAQNAGSGGIGTKESCYRRTKERGVGLNPDAKKPDAVGLQLDDIRDNMSEMSQSILRTETFPQGLQIADNLRASLQQGSLGNIPCLTRVEENVYDTSLEDHTELVVITPRQPNLGSKSASKGLQVSTLMSCTQQTTISDSKSVSHPPFPQPVCFQIHANRSSEHGAKGGKQTETVEQSDSTRPRVLGGSTSNVVHEKDTAVVGICETLNMDTQETCMDMDEPILISSRKPHTSDKQNTENTEARQETFMSADEPFFPASQNSYGSDFQNTEKNSVLHTQSLLVSERKLDRTRADPDLSKRQDFIQKSANPITNCEEQREDTDCSDAAPVSPNRATQFQSILHMHSTSLDVKALCKQRRNNEKQMGEPDQDAVAGGLSGNSQTEKRTGNFRTEDNDSSTETESEEQHLKAESAFTIDTDAPASRKRSRISSQPRECASDSSVEMLDSSPVSKSKKNSVFPDARRTATPMDQRTVSISEVVQAKEKRVSPRAPLPTKTLHPKSVSNLDPALPQPLTDMTKVRGNAVQDKTSNLLQVQNTTTLRRCSEPRRPASPSSSWTSITDVFPVSNKEILRRMAEESAKKKEAAQAKATQATARAYATETARRGMAVSKGKDNEALSKGRMGAGEGPGSTTVATSAPLAVPFEGATPLPTGTKVIVVKKLPQVWIL